MGGIASVCHQHDILSRQAMMYLLTMGWFLAHTSLAMTPEHSATNAEYSSLRSARAGHSKSASCASHHPKLQCDRAYTHACGEAGADGGPAQSAANETPCEISKSSATLQCSWGLPSRLGRPKYLTALLCKGWERIYLIPFLRVGRPSTNGRYVRYSCCPSEASMT